MVCEEAWTEATAQPWAALPPYGCGVPQAGVACGRPPGPRDQHESEGLPSRWRLCRLTDGACPLRVKRPSDQTKRGPRENCEAGFRGERRRSEMSEARRLRRDEGYEACADEMKDGDIVLFRFNV